MPTYEKKMSAGRVPPSSRAVGPYMYRSSPYPMSVVRYGFQRVVHVVQQLSGARLLVRRAVENDRIDGGEPANRPAQVDIGFENRPSGSAEVDGDATVADRGRDRPAQCGQQDFVDRQPKPAPRVVDLGCFRDAQRR